MSDELKVISDFYDFMPSFIRRLPLLGSAILEEFGYTPQSLWPIAISAGQHAFPPD